jgi:hypothetical protein
VIRLLDYFGNLSDRHIYYSHNIGNYRGRIEMMNETDSRMERAKIIASTPNAVKKVKDARTGSRILRSSATSSDGGN